MANACSSTLREGIVTLFIIILFSIVAIMSFVYSRTNGYLAAFVAEQQQFLQHESMYASLQQYLLQLIKDNFDRFIQDIASQKKPIILSWSWSTQRTTTHSVYCAIDKQNEDHVVFDMQYHPTAAYNRILKGSLKKIVNDSGTVFQIDHWQSS
jgi:hypothetical protein